MNYTLDPSVSLFEILNLALLGATLWYLRRYVRDTAEISRASRRQADDTRQIAASSIEQAEATQKPYLVLTAEPRDDVDAILDAPASTQVVLAGVFFWNIGMGPACDVVIGIERRRGSGWESGLRFVVPYIRPDGAHKYLGTTPGEGGQRRLTAIYRSAGGRKYITRVTLEERVIRAFEQRPALETDTLPLAQPSPLEQVTRLAQETEA